MFDSGSIQLYTERFKVLILGADFKERKMYRLGFNIFQTNPHKFEYILSTFPLLL